jgi:hypothetical protein
MGWKEAINTYPSSIVYEIHGSIPCVYCTVYRGAAFFVLCSSGSTCGSGSYPLMVMLHNYNIFETKEKISVEGVSRLIVFNIDSSEEEWGKTL